MENEKETKKGVIAKSRILSDLRFAKAKWKPLLDLAKRDYEFALGKQWDDEDLAALERIGVKGLTINKIQPKVNLLSGIERQNRTSLKAFPIGAEDSIQASISTRLIAHLESQSDYTYKSSEQFELGIISGFSYLEPYVDYSHNILTGELKWRVLPDQDTELLPDPRHKEYDLSDCDFVIKITRGLTRGQLEALYPDKTAKIKSLGTTVTIDGLRPTESGGVKIEYADDGYKHGETIGGNEDETEPTFDLVEYFYKKSVENYLVIDPKLGKYKEIGDKLAADSYKAQFPDADTRPRKVKEIWVAALVGDTILDDSKAWSFPKWRGFPFIPFFAHRMNAPVKGIERHIQGIVRSLVDPQMEYNKRRTQILRIINTTANSGWKTPKGSWVNKNDVAEFGSSPGVILEYDPNKGEPQRIEPSSHPFAHDKAAEENTQDIKEISGINDDLLAMNESQASGRAIHLRQQQGLVMIQRLMDNYRRSKIMAGRFMLSLMGDLFTIESAKQVLGDAYIKDFFAKPTMAPQPNMMTGALEMKPQVGADGELQLEVNEQEVTAVLNAILNDVDSQKYNIAVGEGINSLTVREANYMELLDLLKQGVMIPPDVVIDLSMLPEESKKAIKDKMQAMQMQAGAAVAPPKPSTPK